MADCGKDISEEVMEGPESNFEEWNSLLILGQEVIDRQEVEIGTAPWLSHQVKWRAL